VLGAETRSVAAAELGTFGAVQLAPGYPLLTERLSLRPPTRADAPAIHVYKGRADVTHFVPHGPLSVEQIAERADRAPTLLTEEGQALNLLVHSRRDGALLGDVILIWYSREHRGGEIGYVFDPAHAGQGYATEAAREVLRLGFEELGLHRIFARLDSRNAASAAVLRRLRMRHEAHFVSNEYWHGEWTDEDRYALLEDEWRVLR
jgi:RimJ/RimL family protein N-acetyltransferase